MSRRILLTSLGLSLIAGTILAVVRREDIRDQIALGRITDTDADIRARGWTRLTQTNPDTGKSRAAAQNEGIFEALAETYGSDDHAAILDASDVLRHLDLWTWDGPSPHLRRTEWIGRVTRDAPSDVSIVTRDLSRMPLDHMSHRSVREIGSLVLDNTAGEDRIRALEAVASWLGPDGLAEWRFVDVLGAGEPQESSSDPALLRMSWLLAAWADLDPAEIDIEHASPRVEEARLFACITRSPDRAKPVFDSMDRSWSKPQPAWDAILRYASDPQAISVLHRRSREGLNTATFALQSRDDNADRAQSRAVLANSQAPNWQRRLAAWRLGGDATTGFVDDVLKNPVADSSDDTVYAAALLAERCLPAESLSHVAREWMASTEDDRKRAGALLSALIGANLQQLRIHHAVETEGSVRTAQRLALIALGADTGRGTSAEFIHRTSSLPSGDFNPDSTLAALLTGDIDAIESLVSPVRDPYRPSIQQRAWLIERFLPHFHKSLGRPIGSDLTSVNLHFDALRARYILERRRLEFDPDTRTFFYDPGLPPVPAADQTRKMDP